MLAIAVVVNKQYNPAAVSPRRNVFFVRLPLRVQRYVVSGNVQ
jgi:hypothetical protein